MSATTVPPRDPNLRAALLTIASACHDPRPLPPVTDWAALVEATEAHGLLPLAQGVIQASACPELIKTSIRANAARRAIRFALQERQHAAVLNALAVAGVETIVLKGPALARTIYPSPSLRQSGDLDVLVHQEDWLTTHEALLAEGYWSVQPLSAPPPKVAEHKAYYHTQYWSTDGSHFVEVHYDLWWYGLRPANGDQFWKRAVPLAIGEAPTRMVSAEDMLLHLCIHLHHHGYNRLIWFTDLALVLRKYEQLDWAYLVQTARAEGLGIFVYYSLHYLEKLLAVAAPRWVLDALRPGPMQSLVHDRLCPPHTVLDVEVTDRALFDFHEVPDATELVLNFLLTGRRREKLAYLAHLLAPSGEWLAYYYGTTDPATLRRRRLVHAPRMLANAARELAGATLHGLARHPVS
jgi:hypothetical protein